MADVPSFIADPVIADRALSPLAGHYEHGDYGSQAGDEPGVTLSERFGLSICEVAAWPGEDATAVAAIGLGLDAEPGSGAIEGEACAFNIGPGRWLVSGPSSALVADLDRETGAAATVCDLSHGRTVIRVDGPRSRWVLAKLFAIDFADRALPLGHGLATQHHDILTQIQRTGPDAFDLYVFRSFARSFWHLLRRSAEETGYRVK